MHHYHLTSVTFQQVYIFLSVAETCNFSHSAERLNMTQPGISKSLSKLEEILGFRLFERNRQMVRLTTAGQRLYQDWQSAVALFEHGYQEADSSWEKQINLGIDFTMDGRVIDYYVKTWADRNPEIKLNIFINGQAHLQEHLDNGDLDVVLFPEFLRNIPYGQGKGYCLATMATFQVLMPVTHPLANRELLSMEDIADLPLIMLDPSVNDGVYTDTLKLFQPLNKCLNIACLYKSTYEMRSLLAEGKGVSIVTDSYAYQMDESCKRIPLDAKCWGTLFMYQSPITKKPLQKFLDMVEELRPKEDEG